MSDAASASGTSVAPAEQNTVKLSSPAIQVAWFQPRGPDMPTQSEADKKKAVLSQGKAKREAVPDLPHNYDFARCGDSVPVEVLLKDRNIDGYLTLRYKRPNGTQVGVHTIAVDGRDTLLSTFGPQARETITPPPRAGDITDFGKDNYYDILAEATLTRKNGGQAETVAFYGPLRMVRPVNAQIASCIQGGVRAMANWSYIKQTNKYVRTYLGHALTSNYDAEFRNGELIITGRIRLIPLSGLKLTDAIKSEWKGQIEGVWNKRNPIAHRTACVRGQGCACIRPTASGCCVYPVKIVCEFVEKGEHTRVLVRPGGPKGPWAQPGNWWFVNEWWMERKHPQAVAEPAGTIEVIRAHEFGHNIGLYDEYQTGAIDPGQDPNKGWPYSGDSLMGGGDDAKANQFDFWLTAMTNLTGDACRCTILNDKNPY